MNMAVEYACLRLYRDLHTEAALAASRIIQSQNMMATMTDFHESNYDLLSHLPYPLDLTPDNFYQLKSLKTKVMVKRWAYCVN